MTIILCIVAIAILGFILFAKPNQKTAIIAIMSLALLGSAIFLYPSLNDSTYIENDVIEQETNLIIEENQEDEEIVIKYTSVGEVIKYLDDRGLVPYLIIGTSPTYPNNPVNYIYLNEEDILSNNYDENATGFEFRICLYNENEDINDGSRYKYSTEIVVINGVYFMSFQYKSLKDYHIVSENKYIYIFEDNFSTIKKVNLETDYSNIDSQIYYSEGVNEIKDFTIVDKITYDSIAFLSENQEEKHEDGDSPSLKIDEMKESNLKTQLTFIRERGFIDGSMVGLMTLDTDCSLDSNNNLIEDCYSANELEIQLSNNYILRDYNKNLILLDKTNDIAYIENEELIDKINSSYEVKIVEYLDYSLIE